MNDIENLPPQEPLYNIGVVTRLTGIPITTLHAWGRRYGFPHSSRTTGGHRLYSEKDIAQLRWVKAQVDAGLATSQAILAAQKMELHEPVSLPEMVRPVPSQTQLVPLPALKDQLTAALLENQLERADQILGEMLAFYTPEELTLNVISPILNEIGEGWAEGKVSISLEHLTSNYLRQRLLMWMVTGPRPRSSRPIVLACAPGEWHDGSLLMLGVLLRRQGWPVAYLGQNVPFADLDAFIRQIRPAAVVVVAMRSDPAKGLVDWAKQIREDQAEFLFTFGGRAFVVEPQLQKSVPGIYLGDTLQEGTNRLLALLAMK